jgi:ubiquinone/menaquinone biosynthesis C-methylase UbiE
MAVTAMDPEPAMLDEARRRAQAEGLAVTFRHGGSQELDTSLGPFRLAAMGRAFHWMDRAAVLCRLDKIVAPEAGVALLHDAHPPVEENDWFKVLCEIQARYRRNRPGGGHKRYEPFLFASAFSQIDSLSVTIRQELTTDEIIGRAFSMSASSPQELGAKRDEFAQLLAAALRELSADGKFIEVAQLVAVLARRPNR